MIKIANSIRGVELIAQVGLSKCIQFLFLHTGFSSVIINRAIKNYLSALTLS